MSSSNREPNFAIVFGHYVRMSEGDRSCVIAMLQKPDAQQMTSADSAHNSFYEEISANGWAQSVEMAPDLKIIDSLKCWELTPTGRASLPTLLLALTTQGFRSQMEERKVTEYGMFCLKVSAGYTATLTTMAASAFATAKAGIDISGIQPILTIISIVASLLVGLFFACKIWSNPKRADTQFKLLGYLDFLSPKTKVLSALTAFTILAVHGVIEFAGNQLGLQPAPKSLSMLPIQAMILFISIYFASTAVLPNIIRHQHSKQFKRKR